MSAFLTAGLSGVLNILVGRCSWTLVRRSWPAWKRFIYVGFVWALCDPGILHPNPWLKAPLLGAHIGS